MNSKQQNPLKKILAIRGMGAALTAFVGLVIIYIAFGLINPAVFSRTEHPEPFKDHVKISVNRYCTELCIDHRKY